MSNIDYKYLRCQTCGLLVTPLMAKDGFCVGHKFKYAVRGSLWEWFLVKLGIYEWFAMRFYKHGE